MVRGGLARAREAQEASCSILDPDGYAHPAPAGSEFPRSARSDRARRGEGVPARGAPRQDARVARSRAKARSRILAEATPRNANVRLAARAARTSSKPTSTRVAITGDITDDGDGYDLVASPRSSAGARAARSTPSRATTTATSFRSPAARARSRRTEIEGRAWQGLRRKLSTAARAVRRVGQGRPRRRARSSSGSTRARARSDASSGTTAPSARSSSRSSRAVARARRVAQRAAPLVLFHHHVVPLPHGVGKRAPTEIGMRLDDARAAAEAFDAIGATLVMHGHRHISEERQPAGLQLPPARRAVADARVPQRRRPVVLARRARRARARDAGRHFRRSGGRGGGG